MFLRKHVKSVLLDCSQIDWSSFCSDVFYKQQLRVDSRKIFHSEYLGQLKLRKKQRVSRPLLIGEVEVISNDNTERLDWPLGHIVELISGKHGHLRFVCLKSFVEINPTFISSGMLNAWNINALHKSAKNN